MLNKKNQNVHIDIIKALAILSVILLHSLNSSQLLKIGAPFHIWQAVPIFIILQGYNNSSSFKRKEMNTLKDFIQPAFVLKKLKRLLLPFVLFFIVQTIYLYFDTPEYFWSVNHFQRFITGGRGPGSYFVPLIIQAQIIIPFMYLAARKSVKGMLWGSLILNIALEFFSSAVNMHEELYRVLIIRFIFALALGVALTFYDDEKFKNKIFYGLVGISALYIFGVMYLDWQFVMEHFWHSQHIPGFFYPLMLILVLKNIDLPEKSRSIIQLTKIGKASYHIFFIQILYFWKPIRENAPDLPLIIHVAMDLIVPVIIGLGYYLLEQKFWNKVEQ